MSQPTPRQVIDRQVSRARRRLVAQLLVRHVAVAWAVALLVTAAWMLAEPFARPGSPDWLRWAVLGASAGVLTLLAVVQTARRAPSRTVAALALDERFGLRERV